MLGTPFTCQFLQFKKLHFTKDFKPFCSLTDLTKHSRQGTCVQNNVVKIDPNVSLLSRSLTQTHKFCSAIPKSEYPSLSPIQKSKYLLP